MRHETQVATIRELLTRLTDHSVPDAGKVVVCPTSTYTDEERAAKERQLFFRERPVMLGMSCELAEPGSYFARNDFGVPILATRDRQGKFHAFLNACRHRGAQLVTESRGKQPRFTCPYHAWTYGDDGRLISVRESSLFGDIDKACNGLIELPSEEKYGLLFVHPQADGEVDIDALLGLDLVTEFVEWEWDRCSYAGELLFDRPLNWKLASDTFCEPYHFSVLHTSTAANYIHGDITTYRTYGANHRMVVPNRAIDSIRDMPEAEWNLPSVTSCAYYIFPNVHLILTGNVLSVTMIFPDATRPGQSLSRVLLLQADHVVQNSEKAVTSSADIYNPDISKPLTFDITALIELFDTTVDKEDYLMGRMAQESADSGLLKQVHFGRNEIGMQHSHNKIREALGMPPLEEYVPAA